MRVDGNALASATGFVAISSRGATLVTARHNLTGRNDKTGRLLSPTGAEPDEVVVTCLEASQGGRFHSVHAPLIGSTGRLWVEHPFLGEAADLAALPLSNVGHARFFPYDLLEPEPAMLYGPAEPVSVVGFPFDISVAGSVAVWVTGFVASDPDIDVDGLPTFLIDCRSRPGQSGSPVITHKSGAIAYQDGSIAMNFETDTNFLGLYSGRIHPDSDIGVVWKRTAVKQLVESIPAT